jgi:hypothetical protein
VREQMLNTEERFSKLTLLRIQLDQLRSLSNTISRVGQDNSLCTHRFETGAINPLIVETCTLFPPGNQLLKDLGRMIINARQCNEVLKNLNHEGLNTTHGILPAIKADWVQTAAQTSYQVGDICRQVEEALAAVYGKIKP